MSLSCFLHLLAAGAAAEGGAESGHAIDAPQQQPPGGAQVLGFAGRTAGIAGGQSAGGQRAFCLSVAAVLLSLWLWQF